MGETIAMGDSVRPKAGGGSEMTVLIVVRGIALCQWVTIGGPALAIHQSLLPIDELERVDEARRSS